MNVSAEPVPTAPRADPPGEGESTNPGDDLCYRVWAEVPRVDEDPLPWKCVATFRFLQECLDYLGYASGRGVPVRFQSPAGVRPWPANS